MKKLLSLLVIISLLTGCSTVEKWINDSTVQTITLTSAKVLTNIGLSLVAANNPEYEDKIELARSALTLTYSAVFSDTDGDGTISTSEVALNIVAAIATQIEDEDVLNAIKDQLADTFSTLDLSNVVGAGGDDLTVASRSIAKQLEQM